MLTRKTVLKLGLIVATSTCLVINHHKQVKIKRNYQNYVIQEFDREVKLNKFNFDKQFIKPIEENKKREELEKIQKQQEIEKQKQEESQWINLVCTFYTGAEDENGIGNSGITASGKRLSRGICASNSHKFGTRIYTKEFGILEVQDTGNSKYIHQIDSNTYRIDVYIPDKITANKLGIVKVKGKIIK